ncbi:MAG: flagellar biosynthesis anti-sigma factor FlgM [Pseudobdellovibrionaceae bacterium]
MKVTNNKIGGTAAGLGTERAGRSDGASALSKDVKAGVSKANLKESANVNVSERAQMMQKAKDIASSPMTVDEAKVARLQKMIDEGTYKTDAAAIADRLVDQHMALPDQE